MNFSLRIPKFFFYQASKGKLLQCIVRCSHQEVQNVWESGTGEHAECKQDDGASQNSYFGRGVPLLPSEYKALKELQPSQPPNPHFLKVAILGEPNVGKSTLTNSLMRWKVCAVSKKVHTTRKKASLILVEGNKQIVFLDTPGFVTPEHSRKHNLSVTLVADPAKSVREADLIAVIADASNKWTNKRIHEEILGLLDENRNKKSILIVNKIDAQKKPEVLTVAKVLSRGAMDGILVDPVSKARALRVAEKKQMSLEKVFEKTEKTLAGGSERPIAQEIEKLEHFQGAKGWPFFSDIFFVSALQNEGVDELREYLFNQTKPGDWIYHESNVVDKHPYEIALMSVREVLLEDLPKEVPYNVTLKIKNWVLDDHRCLRVHIMIDCQKPRYKSLLIGKSGTRIGMLVEKARQALEDTFRNPVVLRIGVH